MTPEQAISIIDGIVAQTQLSRRDHEVALQAVILLRDLIPKAANNSDEQELGPVKMTGAAV